MAVPAIVTHSQGRDVHGRRQTVIVGGYEAVANEALVTLRPSADVNARATIAASVEADKTNTSAAACGGFTRNDSAPTCCSCTCGRWLTSRRSNRTGSSTLTRSDRPEVSEALGASQYRPECQRRIGRSRRCGHPCRVRVGCHDRIAGERRGDPRHRDGLYAPGFDLRTSGRRRRRSR